MTHTAYSKFIIAKTVLLVYFKLKVVYVLALNHRKMFF